MILNNINFPSALFYVYSNIIRHLVWLEYWISPPRSRIRISLPMDNFGYNFGIFIDFSHFSNCIPPISFMPKPSSVLYTLNTCNSKRKNDRREQQSLQYCFINRVSIIGQNCEMKKESSCPVHSRLHRTNKCSST